MIVNNTIINNGVDTSDATATAENIDYGYTAYVNGEKIEGRSTKNADTSWDTVTEDVLFNGYSAHDSSGNMIVGNFDAIILSNAKVKVHSDLGEVANMETYAGDKTLSINLHFDDPVNMDWNMYLDITF